MRPREGGVRNPFSREMKASPVICYKNYLCSISWGETGPTSMIPATTPWLSVVQPLVPIRCLLLVLLLRLLLPLLLLFLPRWTWTAARLTTRLWSRRRHFEGTLSINMSRQPPRRHPHRPVISVVYRFSRSSLHRTPRMDFILQQENPRRRPRG